MNARGSVNTWLILEHPNQLAGMNGGMLFVTFTLFICRVLIFLKAQLTFFSSVYFADWNFTFFFKFFSYG